MPPSKKTGNYSSPWIETSPEEKSPERKKSRVPVIVAAILAVVVVCAAGYYFFFRAPSGANVGIKFSTSGQVFVGYPFSLSVTLSNYSNNVLNSAKLSLMLPEGVSFRGQPSDQRVIELPIDDLGPGSDIPENFQLIVTSGNNSVKHIDAKLVYGMAQNPSAQFEYSSGLDVVIGAPALSLNITAPQSVFNGQDFDIKIDYANSVGGNFENARLKMDYPPIFQFKQSSVEPESGGNNSWNLGTIPAGGSGSIIVTGNIVGPENSLGNSFVGSLSADFSGETYRVNSQSASIGIAAAPLSLEVVPAVGDVEGTLPGLGDAVTFSLNYENNSSVAMQNVVVSAKLTGEMFDFSTIKTDASFNSLTNTLTWLAANTPELTSVAPGQGGSVSFDVKVKDSFPIRLLSDKNFTLKVQAQITSPTVPPNTSASSTIAVADSETKISGKLDVAAEAYWHDADSGILNNGPYPPQINQPTQYTVHWRLVNYATDAANVSVSAYLQSGTRFTGVVKSNIDSAPTYDPNTGLVTWQVPSLAATKGVIGTPAEAIFQIENTPAVNQLGQNVPLLGETDVGWTDSFTGQTMKTSALPLDTGLPYDKTITVMDRRVKQ